VTTKDNETKNGPDSVRGKLGKNQMIVAKESKEKGMERRRRPAKKKSSYKAIRPSSLEITLSFGPGTKSWMESWTPNDLWTWTRSPLVITEAMLVGPPDSLIEGMDWEEITGGSTMVPVWRGPSCDTAETPSSPLSGEGGSDLETPTLPVGPQWQCPSPGELIGNGRDGGKDGQRSRNPNDGDIKIHPSFSFSFLDFFNFILYFLF